MSSQRGLRGYARDFSRSKSGMAGLVLLIMLLILSVYALISFPPQTAAQWANPQAWVGNPPAVPPDWVAYFNSAVTPTVMMPSYGWNNTAPSGLPVYNYSNTYTFQWSSSKGPTNIVLVPQFNGSVLDVAITWTKPDDNSLVIYISQPQSGNQYGLENPSTQTWVLQYASTETNGTISSLSLPQEIGALFNKDGQGLLTNPVLQGSYKFRVDFIAQGPVTIEPSTLLALIGTSFGLMGTDLYGRPIQMGILMGLPWALELGAVTSVVAVFFGVVFGGIAGFIGGWKDSVMQWVALVALAMPALPFLIALSYSVTLDLFTEAFLIAALSWSFYAIIARSVSLGVRSQTYVEADKAMGISSIRSFLTHFLPRLTPVSIAYTALGVPTGILLAQTLAFLGIQPENIVTWGGMLDNAFSAQAALYGWWWWTLFPGLMIIVTAVPFVLVGFALDKIVAPRVKNK